jgi:hypothetical protein
VHTGVATEDMLARLAAERDHIDARIRDLAGTRERLDGIIAAASAPDEECVLAGNGGR